MPTKLFFGRSPPGAPPTCSRRPIRCKPMSVISKMLVSNILSTLSVRVAVMALALVSSIVLARTLGPEGRGLFALVLLLPEIVASLALLGFEQAYAVYAGLLPARRQPLIWQSALVAGG